MSARTCVLNNENEMDYNGFMRVVWIVTVFFMRMVRIVTVL